MTAKKKPGPKPNPKRIVERRVRTAAPLFAGRRMMGDADYSWLRFPEIRITVHVMRKVTSRYLWEIDTMPSGALMRGYASGPDAAANAAHRALDKWTADIRAMLAGGK